MFIVIPNFFPPKDFNINIESLIEKKTTYVCSWLKNSTIKRIHHQSLNYGCTLFETWQIKNSGFIPNENQMLSSALGPILINSKENYERIWLLELLNLEVNTSGIIMSNPYHINLQIDESLSLLNSIEHLFRNSPFKIEFETPKRWRIFLPEKFNPKCYSPSFAFEKRINDFINYDIEMRPLRKIINEAYTIFHEHNINKNRINNGMKPINFLWLYGGAKSWKMKYNKPDIIIMDLHDAYQNNNIDMWIESLGNVDKKFHELSQTNKLPKNNTKLVLLGNSDWVELSINNSLNLFNYLNIFNKKKWNNYIS